MRDEEPMDQIAPNDTATAHDPANWLDRHGDALFRFAVWRVRNPDLAEELVQETLLAGLRARERFSGRSSERTWLVGILRRKIVDHIRAAARERSSEEAGLTGGVPLDSFDHRGHWKSTLGKWPSDPAANFEAQEFWAVLDECLSKLPPALADAFALREMERLAAEEVCKILSISASNLWTQLHRARTLLRQCLERNWFQRKD